MTGELRLSLFMISDWHVGTGSAAHGYIDRLVQRDEDGLPQVPAKTLTGVWRDACEVAAHALDSGPSGVWHAWVEDLFGSQPNLTEGPVATPPRPARLAVRGALRMPGRIGAVLGDKPHLQQAATFPKPGVAISPETGTAAEDMLRVEEMARAGMELTGTAEIRDLTDLDERQQAAVLALLWAGARLAESIGGKRRRGSGRCRLSVDGPGLPPDLAVLTAQAPNPPEYRFTPVAADAGVGEARPGPGWEEAELILTTRTPVLAHDRTQGNLARGLDHLPGWTLLPVVLRRLGGQAAALARRGDLVVTAATLGLPVPQAFTHAKGEPSRIIANRMVEVAGPGKQCRAGYLDPQYLDSAAEGPPTVTTPEVTVRMHNTIRDDVQRPTDDVGGVYVYEALAARTQLRARVRVRAGLLASDWTQKLAGQWRVGRSAKDDYGLIDVRLAGAQASDDTDESDDAGGPLGSGRSATGSLRVWLLSDLLVRDARLRPSSDPADIARVLERALRSAGAGEVELTPMPSDTGGLVTTAVGVDRVDSWHRGWGLPRPTLLGLATGSCLTFTVTGGPIAAQALAEVEAAGIGERRAEGFGQAVFNHPLLEESFSDADPSAETGDEPPVPPKPSAPPELAPAEAGHADVRVIERAAWRAEIYRASAWIAADGDSRASVLPDGLTMTQLNGVRRLLPDLGGDQLSGRLRRLTKWPERARTQMTELLTDADRVWDLLNLPEPELTATTDGRDVLRRELRGEAVRALLSACLAAHARDLGNTSGKGPK